MNESAKPRHQSNRRALQFFSHRIPPCEKDGAKEKAESAALRLPLKPIASVLRFLRRLLTTRPRGS